VGAIPSCKTSQSWRRRFGGKGKENQRLSGTYMYVRKGRRVKTKA
jgi:hypothetical protein